MTVVSLDEHRALREEDARSDAEPTPRDEALVWCRQILSQLTDTSELPDLPDGGFGRCGDPIKDEKLQSGGCGEHRDRHEYGRYLLCTRCTIARLKHVDHGPPVGEEARTAA